MTIKLIAQARTYDTGLRIPGRVSVDVVRSTLPPSNELNARRDMRVMRTNATISVDAHVSEAADLEEVARCARREIHDYLYGDIQKALSRAIDSARHEAGGFGSPTVALLIKLAEDIEFK